MADTQCWDFTDCTNKETCPAYPDKGRVCGEVAGTLCRNGIQGTAEEKRQDCMSLCKFLEGVMGGKV